MEFVGLGQVQQSHPGFSVPNPPSVEATPVLHIWRDEISEAADRAAAIAHEVGMLADEVFGTEPEPVAKQNEHREPHCQAAVIDAHLLRLRENILMIEARMRRMQRLAR
jgi:hypothetical protein